MSQTSWSSRPRYAASARSSFCASLRSASVSIWRTRSRVRPSCLPIASSDAGPSPTRPKRSSITSRSRSGRFATAWRTARSRSEDDASSSVDGPVPAIRSPNDASPSSPTGISVDATARARDLLLALDDVHRDADRARLVGDAALDRLADPPRRVRRELEALPPVELLRCADQAEDALLHEVAEGDALGLVALGDRDDEAQVAVDHPLLGSRVALLDPLRELDLLCGGQQRVPAGLVQEHLERVGRVQAGADAQ